MNERACPLCGSPVPSTPGYPDWCERCGWNLEPPPGLHPREGRFAAIAGALGRRSGEQLARRLGSAPELGPRWSAARALAYLIAVIVLLLNLALLAAGVAVLVGEPENPVSWLLGPLLILLGVVMRPRIPRRPEGAVLDPARTPRLHELVARVARAQGVAAPEGIVMDARWNASWAVVGLRRRRWLVLGMPVLTVLEPQQRVALIAHEVAHDRSGELTRNLVVGSALNSLDALARAMDPSATDTQFDAGVLEWVTRPLLWVVSRPVVGTLWLQARLLLRDMQRGEYVADARAAEVAGAAAAISMHERLLLYPAVGLAVQHRALRGSGDDVLAAVREAIDAVPERERERRRRVARLERTRLIDTHPPTGMRITLLEQRAEQAIAVTLDPGTSARIDAELEPLEAEVGRALVDAYHSSIYY